MDQLARGLAEEWHGLGIRFLARPFPPPRSTEVMIGGREPKEHVEADTLFPHSATIDDVIEAAVGLASCISDEITAPVQDADGGRTTH